MSKGKRKKLVATAPTAPAPPRTGPVAPPDIPVEIGLSADNTGFTLTIANASGHRHTITLAIAAAGLKPLTADDFEGLDDPHHIRDLKAKLQLARANINACRAIYDVLRARKARAARAADAPIATPASPVQSMVDAFLRTGKRIEDDAVRAERRFREKFGADINALIADVGSEL